MKKNNVLLIHADQLRWDCLGCYGNPDVKTPNLDALAADGVLYTDHFTVYPVCTPSRYSMLSGQYTHQHNAWSNEATLPPAIPTFPKLMSDAGWQTAAVGKMHFTPTYQDVGFDTMKLCEQNGRGRYEDDYHAWLMECGLTDNLDLTDQTDLRYRAGTDYFENFGAFSSDLDAAHHSTTWITDQAEDQIREWDSEGGRLLMAGYVKPHHPFDPPEPYSSLYAPGSLTLLPGFTQDVPSADYANSHGFFDHKTLTEERLRRVMAHYYGAITQIDDGVGRLIGLLKEKGLYDDTMILFTSDHGEYMGFHHMLLKSNYLYDPLARIPLIVKYPSSAAAGSGMTDTTLSENIDLPATILSCCGLKPSPSMCGRSLISGGNVRLEGREFVFSEGQYGQDDKPCLGYMIRSRRYKLLVHGSFENSMFFDFLRDPCELVNEIGNPAYASEIQRHREALTDRLLFTATGKTYCDRSAPQRREQEKLDRQAAALEEFIVKNAEPF